LPSACLCDLLPQASVTNSTNGQLSRRNRQRIFFHAPHSRCRFAAEPGFHSAMLPQSHNSFHAHMRIYRGINGESSAAIRTSRPGWGRNSLSANPCRREGNGRLASDGRDASPEAPGRSPGATVKQARGLLYSQEAHRRIRPGTHSRHGRHRGNRKQAESK
jgi:hypothetical protein